MIFLIPLLIISIILESSLTSIPLSLLVLITFSFFYKSGWLMLLAGISGAILDMLTLSTIGFSSLFFLISIFTIYLYEKKLEKSNQIIFIVNFLASFLYLLLIKGNLSVFEPALASIISLLLFIFLQKIKNFAKKDTLRFETYGR